MDVRVRKFQRSRVNNKSQKNQAKMAVLEGQEAAAEEVAKREAVWEKQ